jgi:hypothetical protein
VVTVTTVIAVVAFLLPLWNSYQKWRDKRPRLQVTPEAYTATYGNDRKRVHSFLVQNTGSFPGGVSVLDFKAAARLVLQEVGYPLHYTDITELALESGYLASRGRTPHNAMRARLSVDVRDNPQSFFVQTAPRVYGLKDYVA